MSLLLILTTGCGVKKYLGETDVLLSEQEIILKGDQRIKDKRDFKAKLENALQDEPNSYLLFPGVQPRLRWSLASETKKKKFWSTVLEWMGEPPIYYQKKDVLRNEDYLTRYIQERGYREVEVNVSEKPNKRGHKMEVIYEVDPGPRYNIHSLKYHSDDPNIQKILEAEAQNSIITMGGPLDIELYNLEKKRLKERFRNLGYYQFDDLYFDQLSVRRDSIDSTHVHATFTVLTPADKKIHTKFKNNEIYVYPDWQKGDTSTTVAVIIDSINFKTFHSFYVSPSTILQNLYLKKGAFFEMDALTKTYVQLNQITSYEFVSVRPKISTVDSSLIDYDIIMYKQEKYDYNAELSGYYSVTSDRTGIGLGVATGITNRNAFRGGENLSFNINGGIEFNPKEESALQYIDIKAGLYLQLPFFDDYLSLYKLSRKLKLLNSDFYTSLREEATTEMEISGGYETLTNYFSAQSMRGSYGYKLLLKNNTQTYSIQNLSLEVWLPEVTDSFEILLQKRPADLQRFKGDRIFTGFLLSQVTFENRHPLDRKGRKSRLLLDFEQSGFEVFLLEKLAKGITGEPLSFGNLNFSKFIKFDAEYSRYYELNSKNAVTGRVRGGIVIPYKSPSDTESVAQVPYVKQFAVGGPYSIRGWVLRQLGQGGLKDTTILTQYFRKGDISLEANLEYRFNIFWFIDGGLFIDAGNIWNLKNNSEEETDETLFKWNSFMDQMAISAGPGLRFDFQVVLLRVDLGMKLRYPYAFENGSHWSWDQAHFLKKENLNLNLGINYAF